MSTTTALDLLDLADKQTRLLRDTDAAASHEQWESFDVTLHRLLLELTGAGGAYVRSQDLSLNALTMAVRTYPQPLRCPPGTQLGTREVSAYLGASPTTVLRQVRSGRLQAIKIDDGFRYASSSIETRPDIRPADPTDPHPLARTSCALGAMADLIRESRDHGPAVLAKRRRGGRRRRPRPVPGRRRCPAHHRARPLRRRGPPRRRRAVRRASRRRPSRRGAAARQPPPPRERPPRTRAGIAERSPRGRSPCLAGQRPSRDRPPDPQRRRATADREPRSPSLRRPSQPRRRLRRAGKPPARHGARPRPR